MEIFYLTLLTIAASIFGTITGFGISTIMVPLVLLILPLPETLLFVGVIHWFGDLWKIFLFKHGINWKLLIFFGVPGVIFAALGAYLVLELPEQTITRTVGGFLIIYVIYLLIKPTFKIKPSNWTAVTGGAGSGFLGGISGVGGGAVRAVVLIAFNLPKATYIFTSGLLGVVIDASRISTYFLGGTRINHNLALGMLIFIPASLLGAVFAKKIVDKIPEGRFRTIIAVFLMAIGVKLLIAP